MKVLTDFHHSSLLTSLSLLFEDRLGWDLYRPIGMDWFEEGYWKINNQQDTAKQYLEIEGQPLDNTPPLNGVQDGGQDGVYVINDPGNVRTHRACTLDYFKNNDFDLCIASIPQHIQVYKNLIKLYNIKAKLIVQMGNNWQGYDFGDLPVMASVKGPVRSGNVFRYHQEFDTSIFRYSAIDPTARSIYSFVNIIQNTGIGWSDYQRLSKILGRKGYTFGAYGGQCPDGNMNGPVELANKMREASMIYHVKPGGDGFGHIIHNAYAVGRPIITRRSHYKGQLAEDLMADGTYIDLDAHTVPEAANIINRLHHSPDQLIDMGQRAAEQFNKVVQYKDEAERFEQWLNRIN